MYISDNIWLDLKELEANYMRFIGGTSPVITVTKWHDIEAGEIFFDLYLNGKVDGRYNLSELMKRIQEVLFDV